MAVKVWHETGWGDEQLASVCREVEVLRRLRHPHIVEFYGACTKPPHWCLVMEYAEGGTLSNLLHGPNAPPGAGLPMLQLLQLSTEIASALDYLHSARIVHRDLVRLALGYRVVACSYYTHALFAPRRSRRMCYCHETGTRR